MNELKEKVNELREKLKTMNWKEFIGIQFLAILAVAVVIGGATVGLKELNDQRETPEHPIEMWGRAESSNKSESSSQSKTLAGTNDGNVGRFTADLGNSKSPTVDGSQAGPVDDDYPPTSMPVDHVDSALPVDDGYPTPMPDSDKKNPTDGHIRNVKYPWEDYDIPWPDDDTVSNGRISEPPIYD